mmetsp:Transcript_110246/g.311017  ORF Transcript_110246/g.311017 Transcript_110246/m.311017 type:complete len:352 (-) Transcript_110246:140-1195(-)
MFKADGTEVRNPTGFVAGIQKRGYNEPLFDTNGGKIEDPVAFLATLGLAAPESKRKVDTAGDGAAPKRQKGDGGKGSSGAVLFKADGTPIRNPAAFVAGIEKRGYNETIYGADGKEIRDPSRYVAGMAKKEGWPTASAPTKGGASSDVILFKADGTQVRNPSAYVEGIVKRGYREPLFSAAGLPIQNPVQYLASGGRSGSVQQQKSATAKGKAAGKGDGTIFWKADGTPVRNPSSYVEGIQKRGYNEPLYDANGQVIRDPVAYLAKSVQNASNSNAPTASNAKAKPAQAQTQGKGEGDGSGALMFKADGTPVRNPKGFVDGIKKRGYNEPLFDAAGQKIEDPVAFLSENGL